MATINDARPEVTRRQSENLRARILGLAHRYVERLDACIEGRIELTPSQIKASQILLDRVVPVLQAIDHTSSQDTPELTPAEVEQLLAAAIREYARRDRAALERIIDGAPALTVIEGGSNGM